MAFQKTRSIWIEWTRRIISWSIALVPLVYISKITLYPFISFKTLMLYAFVEVVFFMWLYALLVKREVVFRFNIVTGAVFAFLFALILSCVFGVDSGTSFWSSFERMNGVLTWLHIGALFVVASSVFGSLEDWKHLFWINSIAATITAAITILGRDGLAIMSVSEKGGAFLGNTSFAGAYFLMSFFLLLYLWIKEYKSRGLLTIMMLTFLVSPIFFGAKIWDGQFGIGAIFSDPILFLGRAQAATLALYLGIGIVALAGIVRNAKAHVVKIISKVFLGLAILGAGAIIVMFFIKGSPVHNFISQEASKSRVGAWEIAVEAWKSRPVFGYGVGNFGYVYQDFYRPEFLTKEYGAETWMDKAHSVGYELLSATGIVGTLSFAGMYIAVAVFLWRRRHEEDFDIWVAVVAGTLLTVHLIQNLTVFDTISTHQLFVLVLAFVASRGGREIFVSGNFWREGVGQSIAGIGLVATLTFFVIIPFSSAHATIAFSKGEFISSDQAIEKLFKTIDRSPIGQTEKTKLLSELWREQIVRFPQIVAQYPDNVLLVQDKFIESMEEALEQHPKDMRTSVTISRMALFNMQFADDELAQSYLDKAEHYAHYARELSPNHQLGYWTLASVENAKGNRDEARNLAQQAYDLAPGARNAAETLAQYE